MEAIAEFVRVMRYAQTRLALHYCLWRHERARHDLADAFAACDRAWADYQAHHMAIPAPRPEPPAFLVSAPADPPS